ncbi:MAG: hypothetical protein HIU84_12950 [Acidobacteria bacterium]|nr:hypothetical protein [Acidobacteriota bacterium]
MNETPRPPLTTTTSIWPAAAILGIAVVMLALFMGINLIANQGVATTTTIPVIVGGLAPAPSTALLANCQQPSNPPSNIAPALLMPQSTRANGAFTMPNAGAGDFDCYRSFITTAPANQVLAFYSSELESRGWSLFSQGASNGAPQSLFQKAGSDTFYWVVGITVTSSNAHSTHWTYRIYQNSAAI